MAKPVFDKRHIKEYLLFGSIGAILYMIPVVLFLYSNSYQHLYYLFIGCVLFMAAIFFYVYRLLYTRYDEKRAVSMLLAGHLATLTGIIIASLLVVVAMLFFNADLFSRVPADQLLPGAATQDRQNTPVYLLLMILSTTVIGNFATGSFISVIVSYAGKLDQTKDKPVDTGQEKVGFK
ncbi:MAG: hypothetical protein JWP81_550 [Ferruginibacter sp.]|nr:hypothetical protein [Ferruginibacter sp.]